MLRILGIDPGLQRTGYGCVELARDGADATVVEGGVLRLDARSSLAARLGQLHDDLADLLEELAPDALVVEQIFSHVRHARTSIIMGHARGVVLLAGQQRGLRIHELMPTEIKKALTGNGHASKQQMQRAIMSQLSLASLPDPPDVADALAMALCALRRFTSDCAQSR